MLIIPVCSDFYPYSSVVTRIPNTKLLVGKKSFHRLDYVTNYRHKIYNVTVMQLFLTV